MCVDTMNCGGRCPERQEEDEARRKREAATRKMVATKVANLARERQRRVPSSRATEGDGNGQ
jgi:hypothetical protein